jgi:mono/diheme cytochrome c family protein
LPGNGRGPSAAWNYPYARDFRSGVFKFTSGKANNGKPRIEDIARLLRRGIPGTPMPIFDLLSDEDVRALAGYTIFLSLRGEVELQILKLHFSGEDVPFENLPEALATSQARILQQWESAQVPAEPIAMNVDEADAEAIRRGHLLFAASASGSGCLSCHTRYGKDDSYRYDIWGLPARVGNLTEPTYKWGREPNDLALRIKHGILPVGMPANSLMTNQQIQDLVTFLRVLPYPARLPDDVRRAVEAPASGISK